jgi:uncharacterized membrane protein YwzB
MLVIRYICVYQLILISVLNFVFKKKKYCIEAIALILLKVDIEMKFSKFILEFLQSQKFLDGSKLYRPKIYIYFF